MGRNQTLETVDIVYFLPGKICSLEIRLYGCTLSIIRGDDAKLCVSIVGPDEMHEHVDLLLILSKT